MAVVLACGVVVATVVNHLLQEDVATAAKRIENAAVWSVEVGQLSAAVAKCRILEKEYESAIQPGRERSRALADWKAAINELDQRFDALGRLSDPPVESRVLKSWRDAKDQYQERFLATVHVVESGELSTSAMVHRALIPCQALIGRVLQGAEESLRAVHETAQAEQTTLERLLERRTRLVNIEAVVGLLAILLMVVWLLRAVLSRVNVLVAAMTRAASGDLKTRIINRSGDELGQLAEKCNEVLMTIQSGRESLENVRQAAERLTQAKNEFFAGIAEELRAVITLNQSHTEMLVTHVAGANLEAVRSIKTNEEHVFELLEGVRDLVHAAMGSLDIHRANCSPVRILAAVAAVVQPRAGAKRITISIDHSSPMPETIYTDPARVQQILVYLANHAIRAVEMGTIQLSVRMSQGTGEPQAEYEVVAPDVLLTQEEIEWMAGSPVYSGAAVYHRPSGLSLALTICRRLTNLLEGTIRVVSTPGVGSTFTVVIPTGSLAGVKILDRPGQPAPSESGILKSGDDFPMRCECRILLVEDGPENRRLIAHILTKAGAQVTLAENGQEAVDKVIAARQQAAGAAPPAGEPFDVILMDMLMPVLDGFEATRELRRQGYTGCIIAVTGHTADYDRERCLGAGCDDYYAKPVERRRLLAMIIRHVQSHHDIHVSS